MDTFEKHGVTWPRPMASCTFPDLPLGLEVMVIPVERIRESNDEITGKVADPELSTYTVIGVHEEGEANRFAESYEDINPGGAEDQAYAEHPELLIAGVVEGQCKLVDDDPGGQ